MSIPPSASLETLNARLAEIEAELKSLRSTVNALVRGNLTTAQRLRITIKKIGSFKGLKAREINALRRELKGVISRLDRATDTIGALERHVY